MKMDARDQAEDFIENVVAPARRGRSSDPKAAPARTKLIKEELKLARAELVGAGLDPERLDQLAADRSKKRKKLAEEGRRRAVDASAAAAARLADLATHILPAEPLETVINEVTFIRSFAGQGAVVESNIGPFDNWARYRLESTSASRELPGRLSFFTLWQNPLDTAAIVIARANLVVNAHLSCEAEGMGTSSWFGVTSEAKATVRARTTVWNMNASISSIVHDEEVSSEVARGHFFGDDSSDSIAFSAVLPASEVAVAAQAYSLIEVELLTEWEELFGSVVLDAEGGSHRVDVPQLLLTVTPIAAPASISLEAEVNYNITPTRVRLTWSGATTSEVDIYRNGVLLLNTPNDGLQGLITDPGTYLFWVCNAGSNVCSNQVSVTVTQ